MEKNNRGVRKGTWTKEEDSLLRECIEKYGEGKWHLVPLRAGLNRCRKSCRLRWLNYLRPNIKRSCFTKDEVDLMMRLHKLLGNKWSLIAGRLPGRTANDVKNFWNTHIEKKLAAATTGVGRGKSHKTITQSNIVRPRPRTFSKLAHVPWPKDIVIKSNDNKADNKENNSSSHEGASSASTSREVDECIQWWSKLLETTENEGLPNLLSEEDHLTKHVSKSNNDCCHSVPNIDVDGWGISLSLDNEEGDRDAWELVSAL